LGEEGGTVGWGGARVACGCGVGKDGTRTKYASEGQQHVGTATITNDTRVVEEVVVIISIFYPEVKGITTTG